MDDELRVGLVLDVDAREAAVAPSAIGDVVSHDRMMEAVPPAFEGSYTET